jgi:hypothetical protein
MVWVREQTTSTERPPLVGEVIANFCLKLLVPNSGFHEPENCYTIRFVWLSYS